MNLGITIFGWFLDLVLCGVVLVCTVRSVNLALDWEKQWRKGERWCPEAVSCVLIALLGVVAFHASVHAHPILTQWVFFLSFYCGIVFRMDWSIE